MFIVFLLFDLMSVYGTRGPTALPGSRRLLLPGLPHPRGARHAAGRDLGHHGRRARARARGQMVSRFVNGEWKQIES